MCGSSGKQVGSTLHDELLIHGIVRCCTSGAATEMCFAIVIPRYLPIPEGQRPPAASEVEDAEVVTGWQWGGWWIRPNPQTDSGWHTRITDKLIDEITGATE